MALAWILKEEAVIGVLIGAFKPQQIMDNLEAIKNTIFTEEELEIIEQI